MQFGPDEAWLVNFGKNMKLICIEEHVIDAAISRVIHPVVAREFGYMANVGSSFTDRPETFRDNLPHLVSGKTLNELAFDMGVDRIAEMDKHGIDMQVVSYSTPVQLAPANEAVELTQAANDWIAERSRDNPSRFAGFATLPWQDPTASVAELDRAVNQLGLKGAILNGRPGAAFLDDERYAPVLAKFNELGVPLFLHPGFPLTQVRDAYYGGLSNEVSARLSIFGWGWHSEAGVQAIRMILSGQLEKFPDLQIISGHWGEMVPFFLQRLDDMMPPQLTGLSRSITETYRSNFYVSPSGMLNVPHFEFIHKVLGADRMLYSVDYPYLTHTGARAFLENLPISREDKEKIAHGNAERLFRF